MVPSEMYSIDEFNAAQLLTVLSIAHVHIIAVRCHKVQAASILPRTQRSAMTLPKVSLQINAADEPLLNRVPTRDEHGKPLGDLMVLLPGLRDKSRHQITRTVQDIRDVLDAFSSNVVFAELVITRNILWISVRPLRGIRVTVANALREKIPEAKLVSHL